MSDTPIDPPEPDTHAVDSARDPLLYALRQLPARSPASGTPRAAYVRSFEGASWRTSLLHFAGRAAVPGVLAGVVGIYMSWAIASAAALIP